MLWVEEGRRSIEPQTLGQFYTHYKTHANNHRAHHDRELKKITAKFRTSIFISLCARALESWNIELLHRSNCKTKHNFYSFFFLKKKSFLSFFANQNKQTEQNCFLLVKFNLFSRPQLNFTVTLAYDVKKCRYFRL